MRKTKIICTIGPASQSEEKLRELMLAGMNVARFNFSHGDHEEQHGKYDRMRKVSKELNLPIAALLDTKGPEIRLRDFEGGKVYLEAGQKFTLTTREVMGTEKMASITYKELINDIGVGTTILIDDGLIEMTVEEITDTDIICDVVNGGPVSNHKGVNVPGAELSMPYISESDRNDILFGIELGFDIIAASFVRNKEDVLEVRRILDEHNSKMMIVAKIENMQGIKNLDEIIDVSDGIMVARGDMGVEIPIEKVPIIQKNIIRKCNEAGKIVITATQMLDSMIRNSLPTRAEACDICNAIFDGTDAIMLSGESASGNYPIEAAEMMSRIAIETEANLDYNYLNKRLKEPSLSSFSEAISYSACRSSNLLHAKAVVAATNSGATAKLISKYRPKCSIIAITPYDEVRRGLNLNFGIFPTKCDVFTTTDEILGEAKKVATNLSFAEKGDDIIVAAGMPSASVGGTNMLKIEKV